MTKPSSDRKYDTRDLAVVLLVATVVGVLFGSEALQEWTDRLEVGPAQTLWGSAIAPVRRTLASVGLARPRRALIRWAAAADATLRAPGAAGTVAKDEDDAARALAEPPAEAPDDSAGNVAGRSPTDAPPRAEAPLAARGPLLLMGDSMMSSNLAPAIRRLLDPSTGLRVVNASKAATGLSRRSIYDWPRAFERLEDQFHPSAILFASGANDAVIVRDGDSVLQFGTPSWDAMYAGRVRALMTAMTRGGAKVLWLGIPIAEARSLNESFQHLNRIFAEAAATVPGVTFLPTTPFLSTPDGRFTSSLIDERGQVRHLRAEDGLHLTDDGAERLVRPILDWVRALESTGPSRP